jgi:hypothetical protein
MQWYGHTHTYLYVSPTLTHTIHSHTHTIHSHTHTIHSHTLTIHSHTHTLTLTHSHTHTHTQNPDLGAHASLLRVLSSVEPTDYALHVAYRASSPHAQPQSLSVSVCVRVCACVCVYFGSCK